MTPEEKAKLLELAEEIERRWSAVAKADGYLSKAEAARDLDTLLHNNLLIVLGALRALAAKEPLT